MAGKNADQLLTDEINKFHDDPLGYVLFMFPWATDPSIQMVPLAEPYCSKYGLEWGPDKWACEFLEEWGNEIKKRKFNGRDAVAPIRFSTSSGHGIGKSTLVAWIILFILDTRPFSMGMVTANTAEQLRTKTWAEVAKWHHLALSSHLWDYTNSRGNMNLSRRGSKAVKTKWRCDAVTARAENAESFQGLHAANSTPFYIFDEASGIEDAIWDKRIGGATDGEPMSFDFGNPTRKTGYFYENCIGRFKNMYIVRQIDSRDVYITNKAYLEELRREWGEDSDLFKVKVRGVFPSVASVQFIPSGLVENACRRLLIENKNAPLVLGVDVARFGDNSTIIYPRLGDDARSFGYKRYNRLDTVQVVDKVAETVAEFKALGKNVSAIFVDGGGLGGGVVDMLRHLGYNPIDVNFGRSASDSRYRYWGDMMWGNMKNAMERLLLPNDEELKRQLTQREYGITDTGKITLESKKDMIDRGIDSPDIADALALTFAQEVAPDNFLNMFSHQKPQFHEHDYDVLSEATPAPTVRQSFGPQGRYI